MTTGVEMDIYFEIVLTIIGGIFGGIISGLIVKWILDERIKDNNKEKRIDEINAIRSMIKDGYAELKNENYNKYPKSKQPHIQNIYYRNMLELLKTFVLIKAKHLKDDEAFNILSILIAGITEHEERDKDSKITGHFEILYSNLGKLEWLNYKYNP